MHLYGMHQCLELKLKAKVEDNQELEIKHRNRGTKIGYTKKFLRS
jgi:hypothetical protein